MVLGWPPSKIVSSDPDFQLEEFSIFSNRCHLEWRAGLSYTILKGTHPVKFGLIWFSGFRGEDVNVIGIYRLKEIFHRKTRNIC
jgi:hypothetical protein